MRPIRLVLHTHWDREWYLSFERFRARLIPTLDLVLECLRFDERWRHFHLDGQTAMIDDYLEARPERAEEVKAFVAAGRLSCGPWVTLVDEFLVSGESIIRNLRHGMERADELGGATSVGYIPDQFGHVGQLPQILVQAGIDKAVTWRGVPARVTSSGFRWVAPDGSAVDVAYLAWGYGQGGRMEPSLGGFLARLAREESRSAPFLGPSEPLLLMVGDDHESPNPGLAALVDGANEAGIDVRITSLSEHLPLSTPVTCALPASCAPQRGPTCFPTPTRCGLTRRLSEHGPSTRWNATRNRWPLSSRESNGPPKSWPRLGGYFISTVLTTRCAAARPTRSRGPLTQGRARLAPSPKA